MSALPEASEAASTGPVAIPASPVADGLKIAVFTTSYPRHEDDFAGRFVSDAVTRLRERGVQIEVVHPGVFGSFGLDYDGGGIVRAVKRRPWVAPLLLGSMVRALRAAARDADLVHAHWLAGGLVALLARKPFVLTLHGSISGGLLDDFKLLRRAPWLVRPVLNRARAVLCVSEALTDAARAAGARNAVFVPNGVEIPAEVGSEAEPLQVFYTGRLSPEKGIYELAAATEGMNLVVCGDGPLRHLVPQTRGFVSREELDRRFRAASVVVCPSRSEGFGVVCAEAMAHGKPVVASAVGGLVGLVQDGETGLLVPPGDPVALRGAIERLLADAPLRARLGRAARARITALCSWETVVEATLDAYRGAVRVNLEPRRPYAILDGESRLFKAEKIEKMLEPVCPLEGKRVLDIGAGSGHMARALAKAIGPAGEVQAVDVLDQRLVTDGYGFTLVEDTKLPFPDESFDVVVSNHVIEHVGDRDDQLRHLREIRRVLGPEGVCYLAVPSRWVLLEPHVRLPFLSWLPRTLRSPYVRLARRGSHYDCELPTRRGLRGLLAQAGLKGSERTVEAMRVMSLVEQRTGLVGAILRAPSWLLRLLTPVNPTIVYLLRK
jgi:glycosyltransferase involved in cell wall biosynthesis